MDYVLLVFVLIPVFFWFWTVLSHMFEPVSQQFVSDEEFLAAVPNATPEKALRIRAIVSEQLDIPEHQIHPDDRFIEDLNAE